MLKKESRNKETQEVKVQGIDLLTKETEKKKAKKEFSEKLKELRKAKET